MNILVVSGFLGAGKTTFIRALVQNVHREIAILENEYSEAPIDAEILKKETDAGELNIWEMTEGCICCSMKGDFAASVLTIANTVDPEFLIIEPTGVGFLSSIKSNLREIEYERIRLLSPITIVDGHSAGRYASEYRELFTDQVAAAGTIFVSKMEGDDEEDRERLAAQLRRLAPKARIVARHYSELATAGWEALLERDIDGKDLRQTAGRQLPLGIVSTVPAGQHGHGGTASLPDASEMPENFTIGDAVLSAPETLFLLLENLIRGQYGDIIRAKGVVQAGSARYRFDVVDARYAVTGAEPDATKQIVFIGKNIRRQALRRHFFN